MIITKAMSRSKKISKEPIQIVSGVGTTKLTFLDKEEPDEEKNKNYFYVDPEFTYDSYYFKNKDKLKS